MRILIVSILFLVWTSFIAIAETPILSATKAQQRMAAGTLIVLDIRTPQEWAKTGVASGAWPVSMHRPDFGARLQEILANYPTNEIALICATGGRSSYVTKILEQNGITGVSDISEGMLGNNRGPGWIARKLPIETFETALKHYEDTLAD